MKVCFKVEKRFYGNKIFQPYSGDPNCWDWNVPHQLKFIFEKNKFEISTQDIINEDLADIIIYNYYPKKIKKTNKLTILLAMESIAVEKKLSSKEYLDQFDLAFTCNDKHVNNATIHKINFSFNTKTINLDFPVKEKFLSCFSANKLSNHPLELYTERVKAIEYFNTAKSNFELYGSGWNNAYRFPITYAVFKFLNHYKILRGLSRIIKYILDLSPIIKKFFFKQYSSYKGYVDNKFDELKKFKFSICYENLLNNEGYITEKIFDCLRLGVIPIYLGAENINKYMPHDIYIDKSLYKNYSDLEEYLVNLSKKDYEGYIKRIKDFLKGEQVNKFTDAYNANIIFNIIKTKIK
jgi:hypothetical protein